MSTDNSISEAEIVEQANRDLGEDVADLIGALESFYGHGFADEVDGDVESPFGHFYRVHRWVVTTDDRGFSDVETFDNEDDASREFARLAEGYTGWLGDE